MKKIRIRQQRLRDTLAQDQLEAFQRGMQACMAETEWAKSEGMPDMATMTRRDFNLVDQFEADCPAMTRRDMLDLIAIFRNRERGIVSKTESVEKVDAILARSGRAWKKRMKSMQSKRWTADTGHLSRRNEKIFDDYKAAVASNPFYDKRTIQEDIGRKHGITGRQVRSVISRLEKVGKPHS
jgi:hypothetical protein